MPWVGPKKKKEKKKKKKKEDKVIKKIQSKDFIKENIQMALMLGKNRLK